MTLGHEANSVHVEGGALLSKVDMVSKKYSNE